MIDWLRWLGILPNKFFFSFNGEGTFICPMAFVFAVEITEWNFLPSTAVVCSAFVVSFLVMVTIIAIGPFLVAVPLAFSPGDGVWALKVLLWRHCSPFFCASAHLRATVLSGTSRCFVTSSACSSPRAVFSSHGRICNILALSRTASLLSSTCAGICILRMVLG